MNYEWPSEEYRKLAIDEAGGNETLAIERHKRDLAELERERKASAWMERQGWRTAPDGSWRNREGDIGNRIWVNLMRELAAMLPRPRSRITRKRFDERYTITREACGYRKLRWVVRFCGAWIGSRSTFDRAARLRDERKSNLKTRG